MKILNAARKIAIGAKQFIDNITLLTHHALAIPRRKIQLAFVADLNLSFPAPKTNALPLDQTENSWACKKISVLFVFPFSPTISRVGSTHFFFVIFKFKFIDFKNTKFKFKFKFKFIDFGKTKFKFIDFGKTKFKFIDFAKVEFKFINNSWADSNSNSKFKFNPTPLFTPKIQRVFCSLHLASRSLVAADVC